MVKSGVADFHAQANCQWLSEFRAGQQKIVAYFWDEVQLKAGRKRVQL